MMIQQYDINEPKKRYVFTAVSPERFRIWFN